MSLRIKFLFEFFGVTIYELLLCTTRRPHLSFSTLVILGNQKGYAGHCLAEGRGGKVG